MLKRCWGEKGLTLARNKLAGLANVEQGGEERMQICILVSTPQMWAALENAPEHVAWYNV